MTVAASAPINLALLKALQGFSTSEICNAIERFRTRMRNEGYIGSDIPCRTPIAQPAVGFALTIRMRTAQPPTRGHYYEDQSTWWNVLASAPRPSIIVIEDVDHPNGLGSVAGETHGAVFKAHGALALITNGGIRDLGALTAMGLRTYAGRVVPSHGYAHVIDVGHTIRVAGLTIEAGDLLHCDESGVVQIPASLADKLPARASDLRSRKTTLLQRLSSEAPSATALTRLISTFEVDDREPS